MLEDTLEGFTPLHWAVLSDNPKAVIWLLKNGADKEVKDIQGRTAEDLIEDYWGDFCQRYWGNAPKQDGLPQVDKVLPKRIKQMKDAREAEKTRISMDFYAFLTTFRGIGCISCPETHET